MKKIPGKLAPLSLILLAIYNPYVLAQGDSDHHHTHKPEDSDDSAVQLESMTISGDAMDKPFQSQILIKDNLGSATDGADILKQTPGISVIRQGGTASDPLLRGLGGTRLNILIDDVPFAGACNHRMDPATAYVTPGSFDALSLLKGPQSVRNGNSISGTVNFQKAPLRFDEPGARAYTSYRYGSFNQQDISANISGGFKQGYIAYTANRSRGDNYTDGDGNLIKSTFYHTENDRVTLGLTPTDDTTIELSALQSDGEIGNATIHMDVTRLRREDLSFNLKQDNITSWFSHFDLRYNFTQVEHLMDGFSLREIDDHGYSLMGQDWKRHFAKAEFTFDVTPKIQLFSGIEYKHDRYDARAEGGDSKCRQFRPGETLNTGDLACTTQKGKAGHRSPPPSGFTTPKDRILDFDNIATYAELSYQNTPNLRWVAGVRGDSLGTDTGDMRAAGQISPNFLEGRNMHRRQTLMAGFLRGEYTLESLPVFISAGYGHAERAADYWEVFSMDGFDCRPPVSDKSTDEEINEFNRCRHSSTNKDGIKLDSEKNNEFDIMASYRGEHFTGEISGFYSYIDDFILVNGGARSANIKAERWGGEITSSYAVTDNFSLAGNISYIYARNLTDKVPLAQTPPLEGNIDLKYQRYNTFFEGDDLNASLNTRLVASQNRIHPGFGNVLALDPLPTAKNPDVTSDGFVTLSLEVSYKPRPWIDLKFGVDNLLDKTYREHISRGAASSAGPSGTRVSEPGRAFWGRITINFDYPEIK